MLPLEPPPEPTIRWGWIGIGALLVAGAASAAFLLGRQVTTTRAPETSRGGQVSYRLLYPGDFRGDRAATVERTLAVLSARLQSRGMTTFRAWGQGDDLVWIQCDGVTRAEFDQCQRLLSLCSVEFREVAPMDVCQTWKSGAPPPDGFVGVPNDEGDAGSPAHTDGAEVLLARDPVFAGAEVQSAAAALDAGRGTWNVEFVLTDAGAVKFDRAAARLFAQEPKGRLAIVKDGRILSMPVIQTPRIGARGMISGRFREAEAKDLAIVLQAGALPMPLGRRVNGVDEPGVPESVAYVDMAPR